MELKKPIMTFTITMVTTDGPQIYLRFLVASVKRETVSCISHTCGIKTNQLHKDRIVWFYHSILSSCCVLRVKATWEGMFLVTFLQIQGKDITIKPNRGKASGPAMETAATCSCSHSDPCSNVSSSERPSWPPYLTQHLDHTSSLSTASFFFTAFNFSWLYSVFIYCLSSTRMYNEDKDTWQAYFAHHCVSRT